MSDRVGNAEDRYCRVASEVDIDAQGDIGLNDCEVMTS